MVSSSQQQYEGKGERTITLNEFSHLFITANRKGGVLHFDKEDRRQCILHAGAYYQENLKFFEQLSKEVANLRTMKNWYTFFKERDISNFKYSDDPPTSVKSDALLVQAAKSHKFLIEYPFYTHQRAEYLRKTDVYRIHYGEFYKAYTEHIRMFFPSSKVRNCDTFDVEIAQLGCIVPKKRQRINNKTYKVVDIPVKVFCDTVLQTYNLFLNVNPKPDPAWVSYNNS